MVLGTISAINQRKWTPTDSAIRDAESALFTGGAQNDDYSVKTLSGYNDQYDPLVTHMHDPGDPAMDDSFLKKVFHRHYTTWTNKKGDFSKKVLTHDNAWLASREVV